MQAKANPTLIGLFVLAGTTIAIMTLLLLGTPGRGGRPYEMVAYFEGGVSGLNIGAPVNLRGVQIGTVKSIKINFEENSMNLQIPVIIRIDQSLIGLNLAGETVEKSDEDLINLLIKKGLRASLSLQSLLTGRLQIDLDFHPDTPARRVGKKGNELVELPTVPSSLDKLARSLADLPIETLAAKAMNILDAAERLVTAPELKKTIVDLGRAGEDTAELIAQLRKDISPLLSQWHTVGSSADQLIRNTDRQIQPVSDSLLASLSASRASLQRLNSVFSHAEQTFLNLGDAVDDKSPIYLELQQAIREISDAARSFKLMAEYLETHPEALLQGKPGR